MTAKTIPSEWRQRAAIAIATLVTFARALPYPLQSSWDDGRFIANNPDVQHLGGAALARMFTTVQFEAYHPLHLLSYWLDVPAFGVNAFAIHAVSLLLWIGALLTVYEWLRALGIEPWPAVLGTLACGLHPVQVEAVSWASGRKDVLALQLSAASLWASARADSAGDRGSWLSRAFYALAMLAKTTSVPLPLFALCVDVFARGVAFRKALLRQLPSIVLGLVVSVFVVDLWRENVMLRSTVGGSDLAWLRVSQTLGHQLLTAIWPAHTSPMYATTRIVQLDRVRTGAVVVFLLLSVLTLWRGQRIAFAGLCGFAILLAPAANFFPLYFPLQDRYLSLPLMAAGLSFAGLASNARSLARLVPAFALVLALAARTWQYEGVWQDERQLWGHAASTQPDADYAWLKLGEVRRDAGDLEGSIAAYRSAIHLAPTRKLSHAALFEVVALRDERIHAIARSRARELAEQYYRQLDRAESLRELSNWLMAAGYPRTAELPLRLALAYQPLSDAALEHIAAAALRANRLSIAIFYVQMMKDPPKEDPLASLRTQAEFAVLP